MKALFFPITIAALFSSLLLATHATAQPLPQTRTQTYTVSGAQAVALGMKKGYQFLVGKQRVTGQHDSIHDQVRCPANSPGTQCGNGFSQFLLPTNPQQSSTAMLVTCPDNVKCWQFFQFFHKKSLSPGWYLTGVEAINGQVTLPRNKNSGSFRVKVTSPLNQRRASASLRSITLKGPAGRQWQDAFTGNYRRSPAQAK